MNLLRLALMVRNAKAVNSDTTPTTFSFTDQTNVPLSTVVTFNAITVEGITEATSVSISGDASSEYRKNGGEWTSAPVTVVAGDTIQPRHTSSSSNSTPVNTVVTIGGVSDTATSATLAASGWQLAAGHYETAKIAMEIIAPRAGLTTANRYYKAYPGLEYRVPVVVLGGAWPFKYELTVAPSGMTVGETYGSSNHGVITWSNPTTSGSPHTVTVRVTDQAGTIATVTYTITVTSTGYLFIDAVNGNDVNPGTAALPKQTINGWFNSAKTDSTYANYHIIYRTGTYNTSAAPIEGGVRMACTFDRKPKVHYAYPGESAVIDTTGSHWINYSDSAGNYWWSGLRFEGIGASNSEKCLAWDSGSGVDNIVLFENTFAQSPTGTTGQNPSVLFSANGGSVSNYIAIVGNTFAGTDNYMMFLGYYCNKGVIENNVVQNCDGNGFYLKTNFQFWSIRKNTGLTGNNNHLVAVNTYSTADDVEVCWNNYKTTGYGIATDQSGALGEMWDYRNTWQIDSNIAQNNAGGNWYATRNVVRYTSGTQGYATSGSTVTITRTELLAATSGLIDTSTGLLTGADRTNYLGIRGHEVA